MVVAKFADQMEGTSPDRHDARRPCAVAWIDEHGALLALIDADGRVATCTITRGRSPMEAFLSLVIRAIGDRDRVVILGPGPARLALEREYVSIYQRPDRLVDVEPAGVVSETDLIWRVRELAA